MKIYHVLLLLCALSFVGCIRDEFTGKEPETHEEVLLQKAKAWYQENMDFVKNNPSTGIDVTHLILNWDHKDFMKNQSGNTIISIPIEGDIRGYKTGALNVLLTKEGASLGVFKLYKESPGSTDMAYYSGTGQLIAKGFYNAEKGTFLPEELGSGISFKGGFTEIEEVVINVPANPGTTIGAGNSGPGTGGIGNGGNPSGSGFPPYGPGWQAGGGDNGNGTYSGNTPCGKTKNRLVDPNIKAKINELKTQSTQGGEKGVKFKADGTPSATISGGDHSVDLGDKTGYQGGYHNHTPSGIPMLSPPDIDQLLGFAKAQPTSNPANVNNAYLGMVAPNGMHYVIQFNGTYQDAIKTFSGDDLKKYIGNYKDLYDLMLIDSQYSSDHLTLNNKGAETLFFDILKQMGLEGKVNLQRIETNNTSQNEIVQNINLDSNNIPKSTPCP
ncbi:hypothetical protein J2W57_003016 [Chryseobacterium ginsenosidimutans]|nr:hypothetical protein [Chryseobacterium ginsenosidimutans]